MILSVRFLLFIETIVKWGECRRAEENIGYKRKIYHTPEFWIIFYRDSNIANHKYSEISVHHLCMHCFDASVVHFLWSLYIAHINNFPATIVFPHSLFIFCVPFRNNE
jgi:hypothetical protein